MCIILDELWAVRFTYVVFESANRRKISDFFIVAIAVSKVGLALTKCVKFIKKF